MLCVVHPVARAVGVPVSPAFGRLTGKNVSGHQFCHYFLVQCGVAGGVPLQAGSE